MDRAKFKLIEFYLEKFPVDACNILIKYPVEDVSHIINKFNSIKIVPLLNSLPVYMLSDSFKKLEIKKAVTLFNLMDPNLVSRILKKWKNEGLTQIYDEILISLKADLKYKILKLLSYNEDSVGFIMNPAPFAVSPEMTIKDVLTILSKEKKRYSRYVYIIDSEKKLIGVIPFKNIFYSSKKDQAISINMTNKVNSIMPTTKSSEIISEKFWYKWDSMPIVDQDNTLIGVLRYEDLEERFISNDNIQIEDSLEVAGEAVAEIFKIGLKGVITSLNNLFNTGKK